MKKLSDTFVPGALVLAEQSVHLLRRRGGVALACYYVGTLPFILGLLFFWSDMSRNPGAQWYCGPASAGVAFLFVWMKFWQVRFCRRLWCILQDSEPENWSWRRSFSTAARQAALHATGMIILLLAAIIMVPMAWTYAFYQNVTVMDGPGTKSLKTLYADALGQALLWPGQNHVLLTLISGFGLFVCANAAVGLLLLPYLFKWLLGIETAFTFSGLHAITNTTFLAIVCALTYVFIDPILKAAYTLRCFYGQSRHTGDDLRSGLKPFLITTLVTVFFCMAIVPWSFARQTSPVSDDPMQAQYQRQDRIEELDKTIEQILAQRRFAWRLPRERLEKVSVEKTGWFWDSLKWLGEKIDAVFQKIDDWMETLGDWLSKHLPKGDGLTRSERNWDFAIKIFFYVIGIGLVILLLVFIRNRLRAYRAGLKAAEPADAPAVIDLNDENITADDLPREGWLDLAREQMARKEFRQALRAFYLAILAQLGDHGRIAVARYKSNRDYLSELKRRSHAEPELLDLFDRCVAVFERVWYGMHPVAEEQMSQFVAHQERITFLVQQSTSA